MKDLQKDIKILSDAYVLARVATQRFIELAKKTILEKDFFTVALAGGHTPITMYKLLASEDYKNKIDWSKINLFWSDERFVVHTDPESNFHSAYEALLKHVPVPAEHIHAIQSINISPEESAQKYQQEIVTVLGSNPRFDLILLGIGSDGHTASLFPKSLQDSNRNHGDLVITVHNAPKNPPTRISFTFKLINAAAIVMFLVSGYQKASALHEILDGKPNPTLYPAQSVHPVTGKLIWLVDEAAGSMLTAT